MMSSVKFISNLTALISVDCIRSGFPFWNFNNDNFGRKYISMHFVICQVICIILHQIHNSSDSLVNLTIYIALRWIEGECKYNVC